MATKNGKPNNCDCKCHPNEMAGTGKTEAKACCNGLHCPSYCSCCQILQAENRDRVRAEKELETLKEERRKKEHILGLLRDTKMKHGTCQPRSRKACTACNAQEDLDKIVEEWKGFTMELS